MNREFANLNLQGMYFFPLNPEKSPLLKALAQAAREIRKRGEEPVFFLPPTSNDGEFADGPTCNTPRAPSYKRLSDEEKLKVLTELKALQDDPLTSWLVEPGSQ
jgi:hypothetical protein